MAKIANLFQSACGKLRISRMGPLTMLVVDGQGLALCLTSDFAVAEKWAKSKQPGPNATIDTAKIIEKIDVMVCRPGTTFAATRGSTKPLEAVVKGIRAAGMDIKEFQLPPELKDADKPEDQVLAAKAAGEKKRAEAEAAETGAEPGSHPGAPVPAPARPEPAVVAPAVPAAPPAPAGPALTPGAQVLDIRKISK